MKLIIVSIRDKAADAFSRPYFAPTQGLAVRGFIDEVNREHSDNMMYIHPSDFSLHMVGTFDDSTGQLEPLPQPQLLMNADQCVKAAN